MELNRESFSNEALNNNGRGGIGVPDAGAKPLTKAPRAVYGLFSLFLRWLYPEQRKTHRHSFPPIISYLGAMQTSHAYRVADIGLCGFYMLTVERWLPGTEFPVTLKRIDREGNQRKEPVTLLSRVVRHGPDGVGFSFAVADHEVAAAETPKLERLNPSIGPWASYMDLEMFLEGLQLAEFDAPELERAS
jgi:hypothetical protein